MHFHIEIIMPPTAEIEQTVAAILAPYNEHDENARHAFYDWHVIGGRWSGCKDEARLPPGAIQYDWCEAEKVTVSSLVAGKQSLQPADQIPKVAAKWRELTGLPGPCTLFAHSNDQYSKAGLPADVCTLADLPPSLTAERVLIAGPSWMSETKSYTGPAQVQHMRAREFWNGINYERTDWNGNVEKAVEDYRARLTETGREPDAHFPRPDWLCVTVDCHT